MTQMNSSNQKPAGGILGALQRLFCINVPATMVLSATLAVVFALALDGCSKHHDNPQTVNAQSQNSSAQSGSALASPLPSPTPANEAVTPKKKPVRKHPSTISYKDGDYGVSFRYPRNYTLMTPEKAKQDADLLQWIPMNFVQPGGKTVAAVELPSGQAVSFFNVNVNKELTSEQCSQFAEPAPSQTDSNSPVGPDDGSLPSKVTINGMEFSKVDSATEQLDTRYYHRFENGVCYEFAMGVQEQLDTAKPLDHMDVFDKLERVLATVKIKAEPSTSATASAPQSSSSESKPQ